MAYFGALVLGVIDAGRVTGAGAVNAGCRYGAPTRVGAGVYRLTFPFALEKANVVMLVSQTQDAAVGGTDNKTHVVDFDVAGDPTIVEVRFFEASTAAAVDAAWDWKLEVLSEAGRGTG
ncbi:MAG TPA: hypothetical protein VJK49_08265 [Candidatus Limnocylindrales bacterium]|nr:hypothetical protein [Candidatus Limnocylindrales bacterium]